MCGKAFGSAFRFRLAHREIRGHERRLRRRHAGGIKVKQLERSGKKLTAEERKSFSIPSSKPTKNRPIRATAPRVCGSTRLSTDGNAAGHHAGIGGGVANPEVPEFKVGVLQRDSPLFVFLPCSVSPW